MTQQVTTQARAAVTGAAGKQSSELLDKTVAVTLAGAITAITITGVPDVDAVARWQQRVWLADREWDRVLKSAQGMMGAYNTHERMDTGKSDLTELQTDLAVKPVKIVKTDWKIIV